MKIITLEEHFQLAEIKVDYPFIAGDQARTFLEHAPTSPADKEKIAHGNAEKVLKLSPQ
jgi:predicted TIM-barrel fold metal-dependent hydrolase